MLIDVQDELRHLGVLLAAAVELNVNNEEECDLSFRLTNRVLERVRELESSLINAQEVNHA